MDVAIDFLFQEMEGASSASMDETLAQLLKSFTHFAREIFVYCLSGSLVALDIIFVHQRISASGTCWNSVELGLLPFALAFVATYVLGQLCLAFYCVVMERFRLEAWLDRIIRPKSWVKLDPALATKLELARYKEDPALYVHFVERPILLVLVRWNLSSAFAIIALLNAVSWLVQGRSDLALGGTAAGALVAAAMMYVLMIWTEKERVERILQDWPSKGGS